MWRQAQAIFKTAKDKGYNLWQHDNGGISVSFHELTDEAEFDELCQIFGVKGSLDAIQIPIGRFIKTR